MLFTPENVRRILADEKTQTRRIVKDGDLLSIGLGSIVHEPSAKWEPAAIRSVVRLRYVTDGDGGRNRVHLPVWAVGKIYAIQPGRGKAAVAHFLLEQIRYCARAGEISEDDAHCEGFDSAADFCAYYARLNGADALDKPCWALTFSLIEDEEEQA